MVYEDAKKEFSLASMTGFGADGSRLEKELDFEQVRGDFENNPFVTAVLKHIDVKAALGDEPDRTYAKSTMKMRRRDGKSIRFI